MRACECCIPKFLKAELVAVLRAVEAPQQQLEVVVGQIQVHVPQRRPQLRHVHCTAVVLWSGRITVSEQIVFADVHQLCIPDQVD